MLIKLNIVANHLVDLLTRFDQIRVYRATSVNGTYAEISTPATRPRLEPGIPAYSFYDESGSASSWYRTDFFNSTTLAASELSDPVLGDRADVISSVLTVEELKAVYLTGVDLTDDSGAPYPDIMFEFGIRAAIAWAERALDLDIRPTDRVERYDYDQQRWQNAWGMIHLHKYPCLDWDSSKHYVKMYWPSADEAYTFPDAWVRLEKRIGTVNLVPTSGTLAGALMVGGSILPTVLTRYPYIPRAIEVSYSSGFEAGAVPYDIRDMIGMKASFPIFNTAGDLIAGAGIASYSLSVDGLSQSIGTTSSSTNSGYGARLVQYSKQIKESMAVIKRAYKGARLETA